MAEKKIIKSPKKKEKKMNTEETALKKSVEIRLKNTLKRRGYILKKSRRRDPLALDYGWFYILDNNNVKAANGKGYEGGLTLLEVEEWVNNMGKNNNE